MTNFSFILKESYKNPNYSAPQKILYLVFSAILLYQNFKYRSTTPQIIALDNYRNKHGQGSYGTIILIFQRHNCPQNYIND